MNLIELIPVKSVQLNKVFPETFTVVFDVHPDPSLTKEDFQLNEVKERINILADARIRYLQTEGVISDECSWLVAIRIIKKQ